MEGNVSEGQEEQDGTGGRDARAGSTIGTRDSKHKRMRKGLSSGWYSAVTIMSPAVESQFSVTVDVIDSSDSSGKWPL